MRDKDIQTEAIVLKRVNYGEADRILTLITPRGKISAMAKGVRKARSRLAGGVEMFSCSVLNLHEGKGDLYTVTGAKMQQYYGGILRDLERTELAGKILKEVNRKAEGEGAEFFELVRQSLAALGGAGSMGTGSMGAGSIGAVQDVGRCGGGDKCNEGVSGADLVQTSRGVGNLGLVRAWFSLNMTNLTEGINLYRDTAGAKLIAGARYEWDTAEKAFAEKTRGSYGADEIKMLRLMVSTPLATVARVRAGSEVMTKIFEFARIVV